MQSTAEGVFRICKAYILCCHVSFCLVFSTFLLSKADLLPFGFSAGIVFNPNGEAVATFGRSDSRAATCHATRPQGSYFPWHHQWEGQLEVQFFECLSKKKQCQAFIHWGQESPSLQVFLGCGMPHVRVAWCRLLPVQGADRQYQDVRWQPALDSYMRKEALSVQTCLWVCQVYLV